MFLATPSMIKTRSISILNISCLIIIEVKQILEINGNAIEHLCSFVVLI